MSRLASGDPADNRPVETLLAVDGARLFVRAVGGGSPMIAVHGGPTFDHSYFVPELDGLADLCRLVYYDQRGRGRSYSGEGPGDVTLEGEISDLEAVRAWAGSGPSVLLGHSWGTLLCLEYAIRHPDRVAALVLLNPAPASHDGILRLRDHFAAVRPPAVQQWMAELRADPTFLAGDIGVEAEYYRLHFGMALVRTEHLESMVSRLRRWSTPQGIVAARAIEQRLCELTWDQETYNLLPELGELGAPTLVLTGDGDFIPVEIARDIADAIPGSHFELVGDCGHFSFLERPDAVHAAIDELLDRNGVWQSS